MMLKENLNVLEFFYPEAKNNNSLFKDLILTSPSADSPPEFYGTKMTAWKLQSPEIKNLIEWIKNIIIENIVPVSSLQCSEIWGAILNKEESIDKHSHAPSAFSFVYYVNAPKGSSPLVFNTSGHKIKAETGKVIVFESRLDHHVPNNKCKNRYLLSGNFIHNKNTGVWVYK